MTENSNFNVLSSLTKDQLDKKDAITERGLRIVRDMVGETKPLKIVPLSDADLDRRVLLSRIRSKACTLYDYTRLIKFDLDDFYFRTINDGFFKRIKFAFYVLIGSADAIAWPGDCRGLWDKKK
jgi:hypothetical protein